MIDVPLRMPLAVNGFLSEMWARFFREIKDLGDSFGKEKAFYLENNKVSAENIQGLSVSLKNASVAYYDYLIQRVTSTTEKIEAGTFILTYLPDSESWSLSSGPTSAGITLTVTSNGQIQYTSTNLTGTESISRIVVRPRYIFAKSSQYSGFNKVGSL